MYFSTILLHGGYTHFSDKETVTGRLIWRTVRQGVLEFVFCAATVLSGALVIV